MTQLETKLALRKRIGLEVLVEESEGLANAHMRLAENTLHKAELAAGAPGGAGAAPPPPHDSDREATP
ncbi:MAG TPA: hypothetical protein VFZ77_23345 [Acidimicrobiales bacterium]